MSHYKARFDAAWKSHIRRHGIRRLRGTCQIHNEARLIRHIHGLVLQKLRQEEDHNSLQRRRSHAERKENLTIRIRLRTWQKNTVQAAEFKARHPRGRTSHPKGQHAAPSPHPLLLAQRKTRHLRH